MKRSLIMLFTVLLALSPAAAAAEAAETDLQPVKDETVYINLQTDGSIEEIYVVNRLETPQPGRYTDFGEYIRIVNLTGQEAPQISGDKLEWQLPEREGGLYYQGLLAEGEPPFLYEIEYRLNGAPSDPQAIAGKAGTVEISIDANSNPAAAPFFRLHYAAQIQLTLPLDKISRLSAPNSSTVIAGKTATLTYMVLPGNSASFSLEFVTDSFELDPFTFTCTRFDASTVMDVDLDDFAAGLTEMSGGTEELVAGSKELKQGLRQLNQGIAELDGAATSLSRGTEEYASGVEEFTAGASQLHQQMEMLNSGISTLANQGDALYDGFNQLAGGISEAVEQLTTALLPLLDPLPPEQKAQYLLLLQEIAGLHEGMDGFGASLYEYTAAVSQAAQGLDQLTGGLGEYADSGGGVRRGAVELAEGSGALAQALSQLKTNTGELPDQVQKLIDGQQELLGGIDAAAAYLEEFDLGGDECEEILSFVSEKNTPRSVQFIAMTPAVKAPEETPLLPAEDNQGNGFFSRLLRLFKWNK